MNKTDTFKINLFKQLSFLKNTKKSHIPNSINFKKYKRLFEKKIIKAKFKKIILNFSPDIKTITLNFFQMGKLNPTYLLGYNELIIFCFYVFNKKKYSRFIDIGANIGLHSILLDRLNYKVLAFEPDKDNFQELKKNIKLNKCKNVKIFNSAISDKDGFKKFVKICDNTTGNHLLGKKKNLYGDLEIYKVKTKNINSYLYKNSLVKIDAEGSEVDILKTVKKKSFEDVDFILEVNNIKNARLILKMSKNKKFKIYSQKINWCLVKKLNDMPRHHSEGSILISRDSYDSILS